MLYDLFEIAFQRIREFVDLFAHLVVERGGFKHIVSSSMSSTDSAEKLLTKLSGFLIS